MLRSTSDLLIPKSSLSMELLFLRATGHGNGRSSLLDGILEVVEVLRTYERLVLDGGKALVLQRKFAFL